MSKTLTISDELYNVIINYSVQQTAPEKSEDKFFNPMDWSGGNYDDCYEDGTIDGHVALSRRIVQSWKDEEERK